MSMVRCTPKAMPSWSAGAAEAIMESRGAVRRPLPARSAASMAPIPNPLAPTPSMPKRVAADSP